MPWTAPAYLLEAVRVHGFSAQFLDYNIRLYWQAAMSDLWESNTQHQYWKTQPLDYFLDLIDLDEIDAAVVGFSLTETNLRFSIELARRLRKRDPNKTILFGGHRVFFQEDADDQVPLDACDAIVQGEGELTLLDILANGVNKNPGTFTPGADRWEFNGERELIKDLDMFPWPRYEDVDWAQFPLREMSIMGSRGCINRCAFCNDVVRARHKYRMRSAGHVAEEMLYHKAKTGTRFWPFNDPLLNGHYPTLDELCEILLHHEFDRSWAGNLAIRSDMPTDLLKKMRRAGFITAVVGLESGSPDVLRLMKKRFTIEEGEWFIRALHEAGINVELNLIIGFPGETEAHFQETMRFLTKVAPQVHRIVSVATLNVDRSYLWDHLDEYNVVKQTTNRHISWYTEDGTNTYEIRCDRARRLLEHAHALGLTHDRFDADIEKKDGLFDVDGEVRRRAAVLRKHRLKSALVKAHLWEPARRARDLARRIVQ